MTVSTETNKNVYVGDGVTVSFAFSFPILDETHLLVEISNANGVITEATGYTVNGTGNTAGRTNYSSGNVVLSSAPLSTDTITIRRDIPLLQETDYVENDTFPAETHEEALDKLTMIAQQVSEQTDRTLKIGSYVGEFSTTLPAPTANKYLRFNSDADAIESVALAAGAGIENVVDDPSPQLGGQLDVNGFAIGDGVNELLSFVEDASAVNHVQIENQATGSGPTIRASGDDTNVDLNLEGKGTGAVDLNKLKVASGQAVDEISTDGTLAGNSDTALPTEQAVKSYVDTEVALLTTAVDDIELSIGTEQYLSYSECSGSGTRSVHPTSYVQDGVTYIGVITGVEVSFTSGACGRLANYLACWYRFIGLQK